MLFIRLAAVSYHTCVHAFSSAVACVPVNQCGWALWLSGHWDCCGYFIKDGQMRDRCICVKDGKRCEWAGYLTAAPPGIQKYFHFLWSAEMSLRKISDWGKFFWMKTAFWDVEIRVTIGRKSFVGEFFDLYLPRISIKGKMQKWSEKGSSGVPVVPESHCYWATW